MSLLKFLFSRKNTHSDQLSPLEHNDALYTRFYHDLHNEALPTVPEPTEKEIEEYKKEKEKLISKPFFDNADMTKLQANHSIPIEIDIWVDKIFKYYFADLEPVLGGIHGCNGARKDLYKLKGYTWYSNSKLSPHVIFD